MEKDTRAPFKYGLEMWCVSSSEGEGAFYSLTRAVAGVISKLRACLTCTRRSGVEVPQLGRPASPRLISLGLVPSGTDFLLDGPDALPRSVVVAFS